MENIHQITDDVKNTNSSDKHENEEGEFISSSLNVMAKFR